VPWWTAEAAGARVPCPRPRPCLGRSAGPRSRAAPPRSAAPAAHASSARGSCASAPAASRAAAVAAPESQLHRRPLPARWWRDLVLLVLVLGAAAQLPQRRRIPRTGSVPRPSLRRRSCRHGWRPPPSPHAAPCREVLAPQAAAPARAHRHRLAQPPRQRPTPARVMRGATTTTAAPPRLASLALAAPVGGLFPV
jgi:hypothetical protein